MGVAFAPMGLGNRTGRLAIDDAPANGSPHVVPLSGTSVGCVVPNLKRKKLRADRRNLINADCTLGRVRGHGKRVRKQSVAPGTVLPPGSPVNVKLGP